jgi:PAS domain S-box-containing protein
MRTSRTAGNAAWRKTMEPQSIGKDTKGRAVRKLEAQVRELRCLMRLTALIGDRELPLEVLLRHMVELIPKAYQYPEIAVARATCLELTVTSPGYSSSPWSQTAVIGSLFSRFGSLEVCYLQEKPEEAEGPFLVEERELLNVIGELLGERLERVQIEEALRINRQQLDTVLNSAPLLLWATDRHGIINVAQGRSLACFGLKPEELIGKHIDELKARSPQLHEYLRLALSGREITADLEYGDSVAQSRFVPIRSIEGEVNGATGVQIDITKRVLAERELQRSNDLLEEVFSGTHFLIACLDRELRYQRVNRAFARANGFDVEYFVGKMHFDLFPDPELEAVFHRVLESREAYSAQDVPLRCFGSSTAYNWDIDVLPLRRESAALEGLVFILIDRTRRMLALEELERSRQELARLASHLQDLREKDRKSIAREIHDELGAVLTSLKMDLSLARQAGGPAHGETDSVIGRAQDLVDQSIAMVRRIAYDLRPQILDDLGLVPAIEWLVSEFQRRSKIRCRLHVPRVEIEVPADVATALFRIVQEGLTNVARHARASGVNITISSSTDNIQVSIADNGVGITESKMAGPDSFGLIGIQERAAHFGGRATIRGLADRGTTVSVTIPVRRGAG